MKRIIIYLAVMAAIVACTKEKQQTIKNIDRESVLALADDFVPGGEQTKTVIAQEGKSAPTFAWKAGDVIGVIPMDGKTVQSNYEISKIGTDPKTATFDGGVWALKDRKGYAAYYPYQKEAVLSGESLEFSFLGQMQSANNSLAHIGAYDYMYASSVVASSSATSFSFKHLVSLVRFQITVPQTDLYTNLSIESTVDWFAGKASLTLTDGTLISTRNMKNCSVGLNDISVSSGEVLTVWLSMLPTSALDGGSITVKLTGKDSNCTAKISNMKTFEAGKAYSFSCMASTMYVDLGLSVKWATSNLGASSPEEYGNFYAWGETEPSYDKNNWAIYKYCNGTYNTLTKYNYLSDFGAIDNMTQLELIDDAAHITLGDDWRMPTYEELQELVDNCTWTWMTVNKINGYKVTSEKPGYTDRYIFLPACGRNDNGIGYQNRDGNYWSSSVCINRPNCAGILYFYSGSLFPRDDANRFAGHAIRPVLGKTIEVNSLTLSKNNIDIKCGESYTINATISPSNATNKGIIWQSNSPSIASVDIDGNIVGISMGQAIVTAYASNGEISASCTVSVRDKATEPLAVDLGLSVKWATCNIGAIKPEEYGDYFAWGEIETKYEEGYAQEDPQMHWKSGFERGYCWWWSNYKWCNGSDVSMIKYCTDSSFGIVDNKTILELDDDVAHTILKGKWRMPTAEEFSELVSKCKWEWTVVNGVNGYVISGNGNSIFLPASGHRNYTYLYDFTKDGRYWTSSLYLQDSASALYLKFDTENIIVNEEARRLEGLSVRPVSE